METIHRTRDPLQRPAGPPQLDRWLTYARVDLDAVAANVQAIRRIIGSASVMAVVKADAYGHGSVPVARAALQAGASWLGVYTVDEGTNLRAHGIHAPILVFGPFTRSGAEEIVRWRLTPTITSYASASILSDAASASRLAFHLKVDTGLTRSGVLCTEAPSLLQRISRLPGLTAGGIYTHLACSDDPLDGTTAMQLERFSDTVRKINRSGDIPCLQHAANTAAALNFAASRLDMVRIGIGLYGYDPTVSGPGQEVNLSPVLELRSAIIKLSRVPAGTGVGYGHAYRCKRPSTIALIPIGYGDGLFRSLGESRGHVLVRGNEVPIVGRVSMDQITVDVTDIETEEGDAVTIIGEQGSVTQSAADMAADAGTISYEVLCRFGARVGRVYVQEGRQVTEEPKGDQSRRPISHSEETC